MHEVYGIDCDSPLMGERSWRWLRSRIDSLVDRPPTFFTAALPDGKTKVVLIPSTRLGTIANPPSLD